MMLKQLRFLINDIKQKKDLLEEQFARLNMQLKEVRQIYNEKVLEMSKGFDKEICGLRQGKIKLFEEKEIVLMKNKRVLMYSSFINEELKSSLPDHKPFIKPEKPSPEQILAYKTAENK